MDDLSTKRLANIEDHQGHGNLAMCGHPMCQARMATESSPTVSALCLPQSMPSSCRASTRARHSMGDIMDALRNITTTCPDETVIVPHHHPWCSAPSPTRW